MAQDIDTALSLQTVSNPDFLLCSNYDFLPPGLTHNSERMRSIYEFMEMSPDCPGPWEHPFILTLSHPAALVLLQAINQTIHDYANRWHIEYRYEIQQPLYGDTTTCSLRGCFRTHSVDKFFGYEGGEDAQLAW